MRKLAVLLLLFISLYSKAQSFLFRANNGFNYVPQPVPYQILPSGMVLYVDAADPASYGGSGTAWNDLSTQSNHATLVGSPAFTASPASFTFASNVYATTSKSNIALGAVTFIAWVNPSQIQGGYTGIIFNRAGYGGSTVGATGMDLYTSNSVGYHWNNNVATYNWNSNLYVPNNVWSMIAVSISTNTATAYLCNASGTTSASNSFTHTYMNGFNFYIAVDPGDLMNRTFRGKIAKCMVFNTALTEANIISIFNTQKGAMGL